MITSYQANIENDIFFGKQGLINVPDVYYLALSSGQITESGGGLTEPSDPNYQRIVIENNKSNFSVSSNGAVENTKQLEFEISTRVWSSPITCWALMSAKVGGRVLYYDTLPTAMRVDVNQTVIFKPQTISIKRSGV